MVQPNSYANERNHIPHDPDEKDRELDLEKEVYLPNSHDLSVGTILWFPERKFQNLVPEGRKAMLGPDTKPWNGWAMLMTVAVKISAEHMQRSVVSAVLRFEHSGQALQVDIPVNTPWVMRK